MIPMELMIDIETLGTQASAPILAIGMIKFNENMIVAEKEILLNVFEQLDVCRKPEEDTVTWWKNLIEDNQCSKKELLRIYDWARPGRETAQTAHTIIAAFLEDVSGDFWCKGVGFDFVILKDYFRSFNLTDPFSRNNLYRRHSDIRQYAKFYKEFLGKKAPVPIRSGVAHTPLADCMNQIRQLLEIRREFAERLK